MRKKEYKEYNAQIRQKYWKYSNEMIDIAIKKIFVFIQLSPKCEILQMKSVSKNVILKTFVGSQMRLLKNAFTGDLRPKLQSCFYGVFLLILWRKTLVQSFLTFRSDFKKLWSYIQSLEFNLSDVISSNVQNISLLVLFTFFI